MWQSFQQWIFRLTTTLFAKITFFYLDFSCLFPNYRRLLAKHYPATTGREVWPRSGRLCPWRLNIMYKIFWGLRRRFQCSWTPSTDPNKTNNRFKRLDVRMTRRSSRRATRKLLRNTVTGRKILATVKLTRCWCIILYDVLFFTPKGPERILMVLIKCFKPC